jgi:phenylacetate-CoA ligase
MIIELKNLYQKSPNWLRQFVSVIPFNYRLGKTYRRTLHFLRESDNWNQDQYREYQKSQLAMLLEHAITTVPYYQRYRRLLGRDPFEMLRDIEPVAKQQMQENLDQFVMPKSLRPKWHITHTGGSSGVPLTIFLDNDVVEKEWAFMIAQWSRIDYQPGDKRVTFRDSDLLRDRSIPIISNPVYNEALCSPFQLSDDSLDKYVKLLRSMRPKFLRGYPSVLTVLAHFVEDNRITDLPPLAALLCASEGVTSAQRLYLERVFRTRLYSWYGMSEKVVLAGECEQSNNYHCFPQYGITEVVDSSGNVSSQAGSSGEIVGTGFLNHVMPFIRYRLDDHTSIIDDHCSVCGRQHQLLAAVRGHHTQEDIVGKSGSRISLMAINLHDDTFNGVRQFQFHQKEPGRVNLYLRVGMGFDEERRQLILKTLTRKTGDDIDYQVQIVDHIEQTGLGKGIYLRQELKGSDARNISDIKTNQQKESKDEHTRMD